MEFLVATLSKKSGGRAIDSSGERLTYPGGEGDQVRIVNSGPNMVCINGGDGTQLAVFPTDNATPNGSGTVMLAGTVEVFTVQGLVDLHGICLAGQTATIYISRVKGG